MENLYHILGVAPNASTEEIKKAYRSLAMRHHPDRSTDTNAQSKFNTIKTAYELLADPKKRAEYDQRLSNRIILDAKKESHALWLALFERCGVEIPHHSSHERRAL